MIAEETLMKFELIKDKDNLQLQRVLRNNTRLNEIHMDIYADHPIVASSNPFMLISRVIEKRVVVENNNDRLILKRNDVHGTYIFNILFSKIIECHYKEFNSCFEFILNIQNIYIRLIIFN